MRVLECKDISVSYQVEKMERSAAHDLLLNGVDFLPQEGGDGLSTGPVERGSTVGEELCGIGDGVGRSEDNLCDCRAHR